MREKFEQYYKTLAPRLMSYLVANGTTRDNAAEIVQDSFVKLWEKRDSLDEEIERVAAFLWTIARNLRTDRFRKEKRIVFDEEAGVNEVAKASAPGSEDDDEFLRRRISEAMAELPPLLREAYVLFHVSEFSVREIALQTNTNESVVKVRIHRAKKKLQECLKDLKSW